MNTTKCDNCGFEITMKTNTCPSCGEKIGTKLGGKSLSSRIIFFLMAVYIIYSAIKIFIEQ
ncbi:MAG: hypothetical protein WBB48_05800 [Thermodesulfobacteriota bacterium]